MIEKMNLDEFNKHKQKMFDLIKEVQDYVEQHKNDDNFDAEKYQQEKIQQYLELQEQLLSHDLSEIPFESWQDLEIFSNDFYHPDFSKTKANIDFNILDFYGKGNFKNCYIKNLDKFGRMLNEDFFDKKTIKENSKLFLSSKFDTNFKNKYYNCILEMEDLITLNEEQIEELSNKRIDTHFKNMKYSSSIIDTLGLKKMVDLYKYSEDDFEIATFFVDNSKYSHSNSSDNEISFETLVNNIKKAQTSEIKQICYDYARKNILTSKEGPINPNDYPKKFIDDNDDIFLINKSISEEVRNKYYNRNLSIDDVIENLGDFSSVPIENFMEYGVIRTFGEKLGVGGLQYVLENHRDAFEHIRTFKFFYKVLQNLKKHDSLEETFRDTIKNYFYQSGSFNMIESSSENGIKKYTLPNWLSTLEFEVVNSYKGIDELKNYTTHTLLINKNQRKVIETFGVENIIKFDNETKLFSRIVDFNSLFYLDVFGKFLTDFNIKTFDSYNDNMSYAEFTDCIAECLDIMKKNNYFVIIKDYDFIEGDFRKKYPGLFIDKNAPEKLKTAFYKNKINGDLLQEHKEYIPFLVDKNLKEIIKGNFNLTVYSYNNSKKINFIEYYSKLYGNENLLNLISNYGDLGTFLSDGILDLNTDKDGIEKQYRKIVYDYILKNPRDSYQHLLNFHEFVEEHPDIFLLPEELNNIPKNIVEFYIYNFYKRNLRFNDIRLHPELIDVLKNKNLKHAFGLYNRGISDIRYSVYSIETVKSGTEIEMIDVIGPNKFLELCSRYGRYLEDIYFDLNIIKGEGKYFQLKPNTAKEINFNELCAKIEDVIAKKCLEGTKQYNYSDAPDFLKEKMPNLFLNPNAPQRLQELFYCTNKEKLSFNDLLYNDEWLEFLKGKSVSTAFLKNSEYSYSDIKKYFDIFGEDKGLKFILQKPDTIKQMINSHKVELMMNWYDKTGQKFIPDFIVMENFPIEQADKFLASGQNWSALMKINSFSKYPETRDAMLKLAYCFGAFDQDQVGMKKLRELLTGIPRHYKQDEFKKLKKLEQEILKYNKTIALSKTGNIPTMPIGTIEYGFLKEELMNDGIEFSSESIFDDLFNVNQDMSATLKLNPQSHLKAMEYLRTILEEKDIVLNGDDAHKLFGGFVLKYDKDFREFLLKNLEEIKTNVENEKYISSVQKQFDSIKAFNSNRNLTWDLAVSFVLSNKYKNVNVGNDKVAEISAIAGYSQSDFNTLQQIYNYGKIRTFSSIPRIEKSTEKYTYEMLRLDDPLAMAIGTLTDCCQELGNCAEVCMEHSMVDKNGRVFVIKDTQGNIVAQSWVWRNKDVLCFDNIEIPDKAFTRAERENTELGRYGFTNEVFKIYKQAAFDLIQADEVIYKELLENGKITKEQYDGLRLGKVTVGLGYNDIALSLKNNATIDDEDISRPLSFDEPVELSRGLYTSDSNTQYVLEEREDRKEYYGETLPVHTDTLIEYNNDTFDNKMLLMLEKLEFTTKGNQGYMNTQLSEYDDKENIVSSLAKNYDLNPETTRIIMNPNFAIIYDINDDNIKIGDLLYNFNVDNEEQQLDIKEDVLLQMKLALNQISKEKTIDISELTDEQVEVYNNLQMINEEIDVKKGVSHGK